jgi:hypothetical protein
MVPEPKPEITEAGENNVGDSDGIEEVGEETQEAEAPNVIAGRSGEYVGILDEIVEEVD